MKFFVHILVALIILVACRNSQNEQEGSSNSRSSIQKTFNYQPEEPVNGDMMAVIEIGSFGLNYFIVSIDAEDRWSLIKSEFGRTNFIMGEKNLDLIISKVKAFRNDIIQWGVPLQNLHLIVSSSASELIDTKDLELKMTTATGLDLVVISLEQEAEFAFNATIPREFRGEAFLVDIGSGNTKLSWDNAENIESVETFGSKFYLEDIPDTTVFRQVRDALLTIPERNRNLCFMLGGTAYEFANYMDKRNGRYTILTPPTNYPSNTDKWNARVLLYSGLYQESTYSYIFDWDSNFSIGYLMDIN